MSSTRVQVVLSTFNGQRFLQDQIESILNQDYTEVDLLIRDDGSTDETPHILERYKILKNVQISQGHNVGVVKSFFKLLDASSLDAEYIAFCDQDDVWGKDKVSRAIGILKKHGDNTPVMYCSRVTLADENLKILGYSQIPKLEIGRAHV